MITFEDIKRNHAIQIYIEEADKSLKALGYTEHSFAHVTRVADTAQYILNTLGYSDRDAELARIAAYLHDIGNLVNRTEHSQSSAVIAFRILDNMGMAPEEIAVIVTAIGNHDEGTGVAVNPISAAVIIADKTDVRRSRVRNNDITSFDIHDRVNYSVRSSEIGISNDKQSITLSLDLDTKYCSVMDYFEIFLHRMILCRKAAQKLGITFRLEINGQQVI